MPTKTCSTDDCASRVRARGLCSSHYNAWNYRQKNPTVQRVHGRTEDERKSRARSYERKRRERQKFEATLTLDKTDETIVWLCKKDGTRGLVHSERHAYDAYLEHADLFHQHS